MPNWADRLIQEYTDGKKQLNKLHDSLDSENPVDRNDRRMINSMADDMQFAIEWLESGKQPGTYRGIEKRLVYQKKSLESMDVIPDITEQIDINQKQLYMTQEEKIILADILNSFSLRERQCYLSHVAEGKSMGRIADELGLKKRTVQQYIERAKGKILLKMSIEKS